MQGVSGASRARTGDLLGAIQALSQLSYSPMDICLFGADGIIPAVPGGKDTLSVR
jgi:hypothetical protein